MEKIIDFQTRKVNREEKLRKEYQECLKREKERLDDFHKKGVAYNKKVKNGEKITYAEAYELVQAMFSGANDQKRMTEITNELNHTDDPVESLEDMLNRTLSEQ